MQRCDKFVKLYRLHNPVTRKEQNAQRRDGQTAVNTVRVCLRDPSLTTPHDLHLLLDRVFGENYILLLRNRRLLYLSRFSCSICENMVCVSCLRSSASQINTILLRRVWISPMAVQKMDRLKSESTLT